MQTHQAPASGRGPNPIDIHIGRRIRALRLKRGLSQAKFGERIGVTFQQVQKYERGTNRISCSRLHEIACALGVPIMECFAGLPDPAPASGQTQAGASGPILLATDAASVRLVEAFARLPPSWRKTSLALISLLAETASSADRTREDNAQS